MINGVVLVEADLDPLLITAHKVEENSQTIIDEPVDSVPIIVGRLIVGDDNDVDEDDESNQEGAEVEKTDTVSV